MCRIKVKLTSKNKLLLQFSKFLCESYTSRSFHTSHVFLNISIGEKYCISVWFKKRLQHRVLSIVKQKLNFKIPVQWEFCVPPVSLCILPLRHSENMRHFNYYNPHISSGHQIVVKFFFLQISMSSLLILRKKTFLFFFFFLKCRKLKT